MSSETNAPNAGDCGMLLKYIFIIVKVMIKKPDIEYTDFTMEMSE